MKRRSLLALLERYVPSEEERVCLEEMVQFINAHERCFERGLKVGHVTASAWLLDKEGKRALLMHHAKLDKWVQLGGHCDGDPDVLGVAIRESQEESGLSLIRPVSPSIFDLDIHVIPSNAKEEAHLHYDVRFLLQAYGEESIVQNTESKALKWISEEGPSLEPSVLRLLRKWKA